MSARLAAPQARSTLLECQRRVLEHIATGTPLREILATLVALVEEQIPGLHCALLVADAEQTRLRFVAAPHLSEDFKRKIEPYLFIAPDMSLCGTAAFMRQPVYARDMASDARWGVFGEIAVRGGLRAIWSTPILGDDNRVLGTFAMYYGEPRLPDAEHIELIEMATQLARVAVEARGGEAALRESEARFRQIAENIREVFWMSTRALDEVLYASPAYEQLWGRSVASLYANPRSFLDAVHPEDRDRVRAVITDASRTGFDLVYRIVRPDGSLRWIRDRGFPVKNEAGEVYRLAGVAEDVTERQQAEEHLRQVIDTIPTTVWTVLPDGKVEFINQRYLEYTGLSLEEALAEPTSRIHPDDLPGVMEKWSADKAAGRPSESEMRLRRADGESRWFLVRTVPLRDGRGNIVKWYGTSTDIEDRKRAEEALRRSEKELRAVIDNIPVIAWTTRPDGPGDYTNRSWKEYTGQDAEEAARWGWTSRLHPEDVEKHLAKWHEAVASGGLFESEARYRRTDGVYRWFLARGVPLRDAQGNIERWYGILVDIEDRKRAQEALHKSERVLREAEQLGHTGSWEHDLLTGEIFNTSENIRLFFGDDRSKGARFEDYIEAIHPDDRAYVQERHAKLLADGGPRDIEYRVVWPDGSVHVIFGRATVVRDESGRAVRVYGTNVDATERKRAEAAVREHEQLLKFVLETIPISVVVVDPAGDIVLANAATRRVWAGEITVSGAERRAGVKGFWHRSGKQVSPDEWASAVAVSEGREVVNDLIDIEAFDGRRKTIENSAAPIRNSDGAIIGAVVVNHEVTDRVRAEKALRESAQHLQDLSRRLLAVQEEERRHLSRELHDRLGETLTALSINLSMLKESVQGDPHAIARVEDSAALLKSTAAAIDNIVGELRPPMLDDLGLAAALDWYGKQFAARSGIAVSVQADEPSARLAPDRGIALFRIAQEALSNVAKHAQAKRVLITLRRAEPDFVMSISDDGIGLPSAGERCARRIRGLGLVTMRERAQAVDGAFTIESLPQGGTRLTVRVPA